MRGLTRCDTLAMGHSLWNWKRKKTILVIGPTNEPRIRTQSTSGSWNGTRLPRRLKACQVFIKKLSSFATSKDLVITRLPACWDAPPELLCHGWVGLEKN